jgi:SAM-dependent MidA family methyltransferase
MGRSPPSAAASPEFLAAFRTAAGPAGTLPFDRFMALALYHPELGYYTSARRRVGTAPGTDFFTASNTGTVFGELIAAACAARLRVAGRDPAHHTFVEIGAETADGILAGVAHPFADRQVLRLGAPLEPTGPCVVFSNELFDAQPCRRTVVRDGAWHEVLVREQDGQLVEAECPADLPPEPMLPEGYRFDRPTAAVDLLRSIAAAPWHGLFVAIDYGKTLTQLLQETPAGTARAYFRHEQSNNLLARPGEQDLTCHVCWDWLEEGLRDHGFAAPQVDWQESFLIRHAGETVARLMAAEASRLSPRKLALLQLLHPANLGQKFQVLHTLR